MMLYVLYVYITHITTLILVYDYKGITVKG
jgi:hypothetical protein